MPDEHEGRAPRTDPTGAAAPTAPNPRLDELVAVQRRLRAPDGCPWDREQTHESLVRYLVEESFELVEAIEQGSPEELREELGDVLYQVLFHADIAAEAGWFTLEDVAATMTEKMVGRHPHIFGDAVAETAEDVAESWERIKTVEKAHRTSVLDGVPDGMPALALADKLLARAAKVGVVRTPAAAPEEAPAEAAVDEEELGERLLAIVAAARENGLDAERALRGALRALRADVRAAEAGTPAP